MDWIGRKEDDRFFRGSRLIEKQKAIWVFLSHERNGKFFQEIGEYYLKQYSDLEIVVLWRTPFYACITIPPEEILLDRSDLVFLDAAFLIEVEQLNREALLSHCSRMGFLFYESTEQFEKICQLLKEDRYHSEKKSKEPSVFDYYDNKENLFQFDCNNFEKDALKIIDKLAPAVKNIYKSKIFICHASEDWQIADSIANSLRERGFAIWYDRWSLRVGDSIIDKINQGIGHCRFMVVIFSKNSTEKSWCMREMNAALQKQLRDKGILILPVVIDDCEIPLLFQDILFADFRKSLKSGTKQLIEAIRQNIHEFNKPN
jgi:hypothetical protein